MEFDSRIIKKPSESKNTTEAEVANVNPAARKKYSLKEIISKRWDISIKPDVAKEYLGEVVEMRESKFENW